MPGKHPRRSTSNDVVVVADAGEASSTLNMAERRMVGEASSTRHVEWRGRAEGSASGKRGLVLEKPKLL